MKVDNMKRLLDSCFVAKRVTETMKELPKGFKPRHIHIIDCIHELHEECEEVRVSDISERLKITTPSVTKLINELEEKKVLVKYSLEEDKRVTLLKLTDLGKEYYRQYVKEYHEEWANHLKEITDEEIEITIRVIEQLLKSMPKGGTTSEE